MKSESGDYLGHWNLCLLIIEACEIIAASLFLIGLLVYDVLCLSC